MGMIEVKELMVRIGGKDGGYQVDKIERKTGMT